jgi:hypothetical protein
MESLDELNATGGLSDSCRGQWAALSGPTGDRLLSACFQCYEISRGKV